MSAESPAVEFVHVSKRFGSNEVLRDITTRCASGETVVIIGPSGSGKSTLLRTVNRLETIDAGEVLVDGVSVHAREPTSTSCAPTSAWCSSPSTSSRR